MTDYRALAARLLDRSGKYDEEDWHSAIELEAAAALTEAAADIERVSSLLRQYELVMTQEDAAIVRDVLRLEQRVAELEKDAARWRWLCDVAPASVRQRLAANYDKQFQASVDAAIDKSMKGQP